MKFRPLINALLFCVNCVQATTYPQLTTEQFRESSDANVVGTIISFECTHGNDGVTCGTIGSVLVKYSFKDGVKAGDIITINTYPSNMKINDSFFLYLTRTSAPKNIMVSSNNRHMSYVEEERKRCQHAKKSDYLIMSQGIGANSIDAEGDLFETGTVNFKLEWVVPPSELKSKDYGEDWNAIRAVKLKDYIDYFEGE